MLTGYPPFQSTTQDEIYRRVKSVEYKWPKDQECMNDIPEEAKDLVACLLRTNAEERPDLDRIIGHPFFAMHGGDAIPLVLGGGCRTAKPSWLESKSPRGDVMKKDSPRLPLPTLAKSCGVGQLDGFSQAFEVVGEKVEFSLYKECLEEELANSYPIVPLPVDMVYTGKSDQNGRWTSHTANPPPLVSVTSQPEPPKLPADSVSEVDELQMIVPEIRRRPTVPSHASTLRAPPYTTLRSRTVGKSTAKTSANGAQAVVASNVPPSQQHPSRPKRGLLLNELPVRSASNPTKAAAVENQPKPTGRVTRSQSANALPASNGSSASSMSSTNQLQVIEEKNPGIRRTVRITNRTSEKSSSAAETGLKRPAPSLRRRVAVRNTGKRFLIGPDEVAECIPGTKPSDVMSNLREIRAELDSAINDDSSGAGKVDISSSDRKKGLCSRPVITKWVDYTNKFGIGYILANGTVGCVFKADSSTPQSCVVVAGAEEHLTKRKCAAYICKDQVVPKAGAPVEFLEDCAADGIKRVLVQAATYQIKDGATGLQEKSSPEETIYDFEKRKRLSVWDKFGKYMTQNLGKEVIAQLNEDPTLNTYGTYKHAVAGPFVKFYQRLGNVGIWGFGDNSFQFNFPDHTKLIISAHGSWLDFYHLPIDAAKILKRGAPLNADTLSTRSLLSYPPAILARGVCQDDDFRDIIAANDLLPKMDFVKRVVTAWLDAGGLGGLVGEDKFLKWEGASDGQAARFVWVSVGAFGGDERYDFG